MTLINAFSDATTARLVGLSIGQLRQWDKDGFFRPSLGEENRRLPYSRVYSFRDIVSLRVISTLRNEHKVSLQHLKKVAERLKSLGDDAWSTTTLYVLNKKVVFDNPSSGQREEIVSKQRVLEIPLRVVASDLRRDVNKLTERSPEDFGRVSSSRFVMNGEQVIEGTRIPLRSIFSYFEMELGDERILSDYPDLSAQDIRIAREKYRNQAA